MNVLAVDPGGTTGIAWYRRGTFLSLEEQGFDDAYSTLLYLAEGVWDAIVCESFVIRKNTHKLDTVSFNTTTDLIGACRALAYDQGIPFSRQTPAEAKRFATDDKLRRLGWWNSTPGGHANDAARHLLTYLVKQKYRPILERLTA